MGRKLNRLGIFHGVWLLLVLLRDVLVLDVGFFLLHYWRTFYFPVEPPLKMDTFTKTGGIPDRNAIGGKPECNSFRFDKY